MNVSQQRREESIKRIKEIRDFISHSAQDENAGRLLTYLSELEKEIKGKKYGLVFEEHREKIDETLENNLPVLTEQEDLYIDNGGQMNFLIEGDNLATLQLLLKTHRGKIDLIYIDPPYNTGNKDFIYDDNYVDKEDGYRHSKWISFMDKRLQLAKQLLTNEACILISINDIEQAQLKLLCDRIFGEDNLVGQIVWESTTQPINSGKARIGLQKKTETILFYAKNRDKRLGFILKAIEKELSYPHTGRFGACRFEIIEKSDAGSYRRDTMKFRILGQLPRKGKRWQIGEQTARKLEEEGKIEIVDGIVKKAIYPEDEKDKITFQPFWSLLTSDIAGTALTGKDALNNIMEQAIGFDTVKPVELLIELISHFQSNSTVLDFFAGSGTTGHAVLKLNAEDGGTRRFILCTNNENNICRNITYERIRRVIRNEGYAASLKYFKIDFVPISERLYYEYADELLLHIRELVELENGVNFRNNSEIAIVLTDEELDAFMENRSALKACRALYVGHDVLINGRQSAALKRRKIAVNVIPQYYYEES